MSSDIWEYANRFCEVCDIALRTTDDMCETCEDHQETTGETK